MLSEKPVVIVRMEGLGLELIGSVHSLKSPAIEIIKELRRFSPDFVCVELYRPLQSTKSFELEMARERYLDRFVCIDRSIDVTVSRYYSSTPPSAYLKEALVKYFFLPFNALSIAFFNQFPDFYRRLSGGKFFTFGWSEYDAMAFIYERDEYMAGTLAGSLRSGDVGGRCAVLVGRRHVYGMQCILEAFQYTGDIGCYYAGGRVLDLFHTVELEMPYKLDYEHSSRNFMRNRLIETLVRALFLPAYMLVIFMLVAGILLLITAGALAIL